MPRYGSGGPSQDYGNLRGVLSPSLRRAHPRALEATLASAGVDADAAEDWLQSVARIGAQVLPVAGQIVGSVYGGPVGGALGGALGGAAGSALSQYAGGSPPPAPPRAAAPSPPRPPDAPPPPVAAPMGPPAAAQLLQALSRPEVQRALLALTLGGNGATTVPIGATQVPVSAITNMVGQLAQQATAEYEASFGEGTNAAYLDAVPGRYDATNPVERADATRKLFEQEDAVRARFSRRPRRVEASEAYDAYPDSEGDDGVYDNGWTDRDYQEATLLIAAFGGDAEA